MYISHKPKFTKLLKDVKGSMAVLMQQSTLRSFHPLWNARAQNKDGERVNSH